MNYELEEETQEKVLAEYWATIHDGKIMVLGEGYPPQELIGCQIALSKEEHNLLRVLNCKIDNVEDIVRSIKAKIKANGS